MSCRRNGKNEAHMGWTHERTGKRDGMPSKQETHEDDEERGIHPSDPSAWSSRWMRWQRGESRVVHHTVMMV